MSVLFFSHPKETDLALFAGGELGPLARWRIERHLQQCDGCQEAVADFFHLQSEVSELAQTPVVDWNALAEEIGARVRLEVPPPDAKPQGWAAHPRVWQFGLATATVLCAFLIVRQLPTIQNGARQAPQAEALMVDPAAGMASSTPTDEPQKAVVSDESKSPVAALQFAKEASSRDELFREAKDTAADSGQLDQAPGEVAPLGELASAAQPRQDDSFAAGSGSARAVAPDLEAPAAPEPVVGQAREKAASSPSDGLLSFATPLEQTNAADANADLRQRAAQASRAAAPPPPASSAPAEADVAVLRDRQAAQPAAEGRQNIVGARRSAAGNAVGNESANLRAELEQTPKTEIRSQMRRVQPAALLKKTVADEGWPTGPGFSVLPAALEDPAADVGVASDGRISVRSVDAGTNTITITDVYVP